MMRMAWNQVGIGSVLIRQHPGDHHKDDGADREGDGGKAQCSGALLIIEELEGQGALEWESQADAEAHDAAEDVDCRQRADEVGQHAKDNDATHGDQSHGLEFHLAQGRAGH